MPLHLLDPFGLKGEPDVFYICWRQARDKCGEKLNLSHTDIYSEQCGEIRVGFGGEQVLKNPRKAPINEPGWECQKLRRENYADTYHDCEIPTLIILTLLGQVDTADRYVHYGIGAKKKCKDATDADIIDCLKKAPVPGDRSRGSGPVNNCQIDVQNAQDSCCLSGFTGLGLMKQCPKYVPHNDASHATSPK